ncbi:MAG: phosphatase PAP2 family protein, partial [Hyphomicrobiales bacterium]
GTLPSGHATEAFLLARILWKVIRASQVPQYAEVQNDRSIWGDMFMRQAARIAINRTVAGVHFPVDSVAGAILGLTLADYLAGRCTYSSHGPGEYERTKAIFEGTDFDPFDDFHWHLLYDPKTDKQPARSPNTGAPPWMKVKTRDIPNTVSEAPALQWLWEKAVAEWVEPEPIIQAR